MSLGNQHNPNAYVPSHRQHFQDPASVLFEGEKAIFLPIIFVRQASPELE